METKTNAIVVTVIVVFVLFIAIVFKTIIEKRRKSLAISSTEREKNINKAKNEPRGKQPSLWGIPSWGLALISVFIIFMLLMVIGESIKTETIAAEVLVYIIWGIVNAVCCFFIVRQNYKSVWYVPLIINVIFIIPALVESMETSDWIAICGILSLSLVASIIGARMGRRRAISDNP